MDARQLTHLLEVLGLPALISTVLTVLVKTIFDARRRSSKETLMHWLSQTSATEPFKSDERALRALHELRQSLVFERAFGLKVESGLRNELLLFAESRRESMQLQEVMKAGRSLSRLSLARLRNPKLPKALRMNSRVLKPIAYFSICLGYLMFILSMYPAEKMKFDIRLTLIWMAGGLVYGGLILAFGMYLLRRVRRFETVADFLSWRSENDHTVPATQSKIDGDPSNAS